MEARAPMSLPYQEAWGIVAIEGAPGNHARLERGPQMSKTVILSSARTPVGKLGGWLSFLDATALGGRAIGAAMERAVVAPTRSSMW